MKYRTCPSCDEDLPLNEDNFYRDASGPDGFSLKCKDCIRKNQEDFKLNRPKPRERIFTPGFELACTKDRLKRLNKKSGSMFKDAF